MTTYTVTAWCGVAHYTTFEVDADSIEEALSKGKIQARDEDAQPCTNAEFDWDEFEVFSEADDTDFISDIKPSRRAEIAAPVLLAALQRFEEAWRIWADDTRPYAQLAVSCEMFHIYQQARSAIAEATESQGRAL